MKLSFEIEIPKLELRIMRITMKVKKMTTNSEHFVVYFLYPHRYNRFNARTCRLKENFILI